MAVMEVGEQRFQWSHMMSNSLRKSSLEKSPNKETTAAFNNSNKREKHNNAWEPGRILTFQSQLMTRLKMPIYQNNYNSYKETGKCDQLKEWQKQIFKKPRHWSYKSKTWNELS